MLRIYHSDILGNRAWRNKGKPSGTQRYTWDILNRLESFCTTSSGAVYTYRADGMRVQKVEGLSLLWVPDDKEESSGHHDEIWAVNRPTTRYFYDGQMMFETDYTHDSGNNTYVDVTRHGLGARGIDLLEKYTDSNQQTLLGFPVYDGHGNMIATLFRDAQTGGYTVADQRLYGAWGEIRGGATNGDPKGRYVANLGHVQDDESGLIYMRARYYEPSTGRFVSEDPAMDGDNWLIYCGNNPVTRVDSTGCVHLSDQALARLLQQLSLNILMAGQQAKIIAGAALLFMQTWLTLGIFDTPIRDVELVRKRSWISTFQGEVSVISSPGHGSVKDRAQAVIDTYAMMLVLAMWVMNDDDLYSLN